MIAIVANTLYLGWAADFNASRTKPKPDGTTEVEDPPPRALRGPGVTGSVRCGVTGGSEVKNSYRKLRQQPIEEKSTAVDWAPWRTGREKRGGSRRIVG